MDDPRNQSEQWEPVIERNGAEYLVTCNGTVFVALSLRAAEYLARRMTRGNARPPSSEPPADPCAGAVRSLPGAAGPQA